MRITSIEDLAEHVSANEATHEAISSRVYKDTACGAWVDLDDSRCVVLGSIVEGSNVEPIVTPRRLWFPFDSDLFDQALASIEEDVDVCWKHVNECADDCSGEECGYTAHAGALVVDVGAIPKHAKPHEPRRYRVRLAKSIVGFVPVTVRDLRAHKTCDGVPEPVREWLGCAGPRDAVPYDSDEGKLLALLWETPGQYASRRTSSALWLTTDEVK